MVKKLANLPYVRLSRLAKECDLIEDEILDYGINGKLKIRALSNGWELQVGYYLDDGPHIPIEERSSNEEWSTPVYESMLKVNPPALLRHG